MADTTTSLVGKDIDAWCNKCKLMLAHVVVAMKNGKPYKVQCNTCEAGHVYRAGPPGTRSKSTRAPKVTEWQRMMAKNDEESAVPYRPNQVFEPGSLIRHKTLGVGLVTEAKGPTKIAVLFEKGETLLIHAR